MIKPAVPIAGALLLCIAAAPAAAQTAQAPSDWQVDAAAGVVSDYRYRGYSLSGSDPAVQAGVTLTHMSGFYGDAYLSTIDEYGTGADGKGATVEATITLGWAGLIGEMDVDAGVAIYRYPGGHGVNYYEIPIQVGQTYGPLTWAIGAAWAPGGQSALGDHSNRYVWAGVELAPDRAPVSLKASLGYEKGAYAPAGKSDWLIGATVPVGHLNLGLDYVDSDADKAALVGRVFVRF